MNRKQRLSLLLETRPNAGCEETEDDSDKTGDENVSHSGYELGNGK